MIVLEVIEVLGAFLGGGSFLVLSYLAITSFARWWGTGAGIAAFFFVVPVTFFIFPLLHIQKEESSKTVITLWLLIWVGWLVTLMAGGLAG